MKAELKSSVRHLFDSPDISFSMLLTAARRNELEEVEQKPVRVQNKAAKIEKVHLDDLDLYEIEHQTVFNVSGKKNHLQNP